MKAYNIMEIFVRLSIAWPDRSLTHFPDFRLLSTTDDADDDADARDICMKIRREKKTTFPNPSLTQSPPASFTSH